MSRWMEASDVAWRASTTMLMILSNSPPKKERRKLPVEKENGENGREMGCRPFSQKWNELSLLWRFASRWSLVICQQGEDVVIVKAIRRLVSCVWPRSRFQDRRESPQIRGKRVAQKLHENKKMWYVESVDSIKTTIAPRRRY